MGNKYNTVLNTKMIIWLTYVMRNAVSYTAEQERTGLKMVNTTVPDALHYNSLLKPVVFVIKRKSCTSNSI